MILEAHAYFLRWAQYVLLPIPGEGLGYGKNILLRIMEGRGTLMPGAPRRSGKPRIHDDSIAREVERFVNGLGARDKRLLKVYYLDQSGMTVEQKAWRLKISVRSVYIHLDRLHGEFLAQQCSDQVKK